MDLYLKPAAVVMTTAPDFGALRLSGFVGRRWSTVGAVEIGVSELL